MTFEIDDWRYTALQIADRDGFAKDLAVARATEKKDILELYAMNITGLIEKDLRE